MEDIAYNYAEEDIEEEEDYELIGGEKFIMSLPSVNHNLIISKLTMPFANYIDSNNIKAIVLYGAEVYLSDDDQYRPDLSVVCDFNFVKTGKKVYGVPDLVVEVLSESTMKNDLGKKKDAYEKNGVKEYWIIDQWSKRIEVYHLINGKYKLDDVYKADSEDENVSKQIKVSIFNDLLVDVQSVFKWWFSGNE